MSGREPMPERIQLSRRKGWRMPLNAKSVARPHKWGNPFSVDGEIGFDPDGNDYWFPGGRPDAIKWAVAAFREWITEELQVNPPLIDAFVALRGHDLACWCALDQPCHADVLLELANGDTNQ